MQPSEPFTFIGVDVSSKTLVIASHPDDAHPRSVANTPDAIVDWLAGLPRDAAIAMESTGRYHLLLAQLAHARGLRVVVLNARDVFFHARALGTRGKTDRVDARLIAHYLAQHHARLHAWAPGSPAQQQLHDLFVRRASLAHHRASIRQCTSGVKLPEAELKALEDAYAALLKAIDREVVTLVASDADLAAGSARLRTVMGIGPQTSAVLATLFSRVAFANADALVAYCGLDPRPNDSGDRHGKRRLTKRGAPLLRRLVYLMGMTASHSKALKPLYEAIRARNRATTEACVILGRKLLRAAFAVWRSGKAFDCQRFLAGQVVLTT